MRWLRGLFLPLSLLTLMTAALFVPLPVFLERPGPPVSLAACVEVDDEEATPVAGDYLLMTITVEPGTTVDALVAAVDGDTKVVSQRQFIPAGVDRNAYFRQQRQEFVTTADVAAAVGLQAAGLPTEVSGDGVSVTQVAADTPADGVLTPGDIITEINDAPVTMDEELYEAVASAPAGEPLTVRGRRQGRPLEVTLTPVEVEGRPIIGILPETVNPRVTLPVAVDVASGATGGPSAGLTIALTVYDQVLPGVDLAGGRVVAGTGTIDYAGQVGSVGGAGLKVVAAHRAGADVFLVPAANHAEAVAGLPPGSPLEIVPVTTFEDARLALEEGAGDDAETAAQARPCPYDSAAAALPRPPETPR